MRMQEFHRKSLQPCVKNLPRAPLPGDSAPQQVCKQVLIGGLDRTGTSLWVPSPHTVASHSVYSGRRLLIVLLLAGSCGVLASKIREYRRGRGPAKCGSVCGGESGTECEAGCRCLKFLNTGLCWPMLEQPKCGGGCGPLLKTYCESGCTCIYDGFDALGFCMPYGTAECGGECSTMLGTRCPAECTCVLRQPHIADGGGTCRRIMSARELLGPRFQGNWSDAEFNEWISQRNWTDAEWTTWYWRVRAVVP
nr:uncharacterized protein LOC129386834 isoform X1 [Dermacentor andersoni]